MKKFSSFTPLLLGCCFAFLTSCDDAAENPGDYSQKCTLEVTAISTKSGTAFDVVKVGETDSVLPYSGITAHIVTLDPIQLGSPADTVQISLKSNARWMVPMPSNGGKAQWFFTQNLAGGGDGVVRAAVSRNRNKSRSVPAVQYIITSDSTQWYKVTFRQSGERD